MSVAELAESAEGLPRTAPKFRPRIVVLTVAALLVLAAFLLVGPIGLGNGPLGVPSMNGRFGFSTTRPTAYVATLVNTGGSTAVIDAVSVTSANGYVPVQVLTLRVAWHSTYGCVYTLVSDVTGCARTPLAPLAGFGVGPHANAVAGQRGGPALVEDCGPILPGRWTAGGRLSLHAV